MRGLNWGVVVAIVVAIVVAVSVSSCAAIRGDREGRVPPPESAAPSPEESSTSPGPTASGASASPTRGEQACAPAGGHADGCAVPGYADRPFSVYVPSSYEASRAALPLMVFLHGGGGNAEQTQSTTCPWGRLDDPACLHNVGDVEGFITVYPNGTPSRLLPRLRTWNAGGGGDFACASGRACDDNVDDIAYLNAVLDEVEEQYRIDERRIYFMGFSNGAAMTHRVGCEMADRVAAIVPVSGSNEFSTESECRPAAPITVAYVHGTDDNCWTYESSTQACLDESPLPKLGAQQGIDVWAAVHHCDPEPISAWFQDANPDDGTETVMHDYVNCDAGVRILLLEIKGGGHGFPGGDQFTPGLGSGGASPRDWGAELLWDFISQAER